MAESRLPKIITKVAYLKFCEGCGKHCHIVFANGEKSNEFCSKDAGCESVVIYEQNGRLSKEEALELKSQILRSKLRSQVTEMDLALAGANFIEKLTDFAGGSAEDKDPGSYPFPGCVSNN